MKISIRLSNQSLAVLQIPASMYLRRWLYRKQCDMRLIYNIFSKLWYWQDERNRSAAVFSLLAQRLFPLNLNILWNCRFSKFFWNHLNFLFFLYQKCATLPTVIVLKKRKWILYPYSIFHAKIWASFIFVLSIIPLHNSLTNFSDVNQVEQSTTCFFAGL